MSAVITQTDALSHPAGAAATAPGLVLQPGTVIDARVLATAENLARILIDGHAIEVLSEIVLRPGTNLKLAVSQATDGTVRLAIVPPDAPSVGVTVQPAVSKIASAPALAPSSPEAVAVSHAVQTAAPRQASLSPLFANLPVIVAARSVPEQVQDAASQLLATRAPLDGTLTAGDLRQAFQKSGLFLEAMLARGVAPAGAPDLKAALVVFKQVLTTWLGPEIPTAQSSRGGTSSVAPSQPLYGLPQNSALAAASPVIARAAINAATLPPANTAVAAADAGESSAEDQAHAFSSVPTRRAARAPAGAPGESVSTAARALARDVAAPSRGPVPPTSDDPATRLSAAPARLVAARQPSDPVPPLRGALPSAQPVASPSLAADTAPTSIAQQLLEQTDAALARQTLLQVASLPPEPGGANQNAQSRWSFEIPFATPQGTAVAQFEIARDGGNDVEAASPSRVWRARFSLDVEPAGPVHALVSLVGDKTAVRMWAERPGLPQSFAPTPTR